MMKPKKPIKPEEPTLPEKPIEPEEYVKERVEKFILNNEPGDVQIYLTSILDELPKDVDMDSVRLNIYFEGGTDCCCGCCSYYESETTLLLTYDHPTKKVKTKYYASKMKHYKKFMKVYETKKEFFDDEIRRYEKAMDEYERDMQKYEEDLMAYNLCIAEARAEDLKKQLNNTNKNIDKIKRKINKEVTNG